MIGKEGWDIEIKDLEREPRKVGIQNKKRFY